jgi:hypothetical protein
MSRCGAPRIVLPSKRIDPLDAHLPSVGAANNFGGIRWYGSAVLLPGAGAVNGA